MRVSQMKTLNIFEILFIVQKWYKAVSLFNIISPHAQCKSSSAYKVHKFLYKKILLVVRATTHARHCVLLHQNGTSFLPLLL